MSLSRLARLALIERPSTEVPLIRQADLLSLSRSSLYDQPVPPSAEEVALKHHTWPALYSQSVLWFAAHRRHAAPRGGDY